jgi:predicted dehydrogenase
MAETAGPVDLIHLAGEAGDRCVVRVIGRFEPGVLTGHDILRAEVIVSSNGVQGELALFLLPEDLDEWQDALDGGLSVGSTAAIAGDRGPGIVLRVQRNRRVAVRVHETDHLDVAMKFPIGPGWVDDLRQRLARVHWAWPREVLRTTPGVYEWSPDRHR